MLKTILRIALTIKCDLNECLTAKFIEFYPVIAKPF